MIDRFIYAYLLCLAVIVGTSIGLPTVANAQGLDFPDVQTNQKIKVGFEENGISFEGKSNVTGYNDGVFLPYLNKFQDYSGAVYKAQAQQIFLSRTRGADNAVAVLMNDLALEPWKGRADALAALGYAGEKARAAIPEVISLLDDPQREVRLNALWALMNIDPEDPQVIEATIRFFDKRLADHPRMAFWALSLTGDKSKEVIDLVVLKTIKFANLIIQDSLVFLNDSDYVPSHILHENLVHYDLRHRYNTILIIAGLNNINRARFVPELILLVNDFNGSIRVAAAYTIGLIGRPAQRAASALRNAVSTSEGQAYDISTWALRRVQAPERR